MSRPDSLDRTIFSLVQSCPSCGARSQSAELVCPHDGTLLAQGMPAGTKIDGRYIYESTIGSGGMGLVVKAYDERLGKYVAVKMLFQNSQAELSRFRQEAKVVSNLDHKNIVKVLDFGVTKDDLAFMVLEFIEGVDLATYLAERGALSESETLQLFSQLFDALQYAHSRGVFHRDIKPSNIMLVSRNDQLLVKLVDFGIAKVTGPGIKAESKLTQTGQIIGSPKYMSPEQALGKTVDGRSDIYSAGCVLFHALTGAPPIMGETSIETLFNHVNSKAPTLSEASLGRVFSHELESVVQKSMSKTPAERQQTFTQLQDEFTQALQPTSAKRARSGQTSVSSTKTAAVERKSKLPVAMLVIASALAAVVGLCIYCFKMTQTDPLEAIKPAVVDKSDLYPELINHTTKEVHQAASKVFDSGMTAAAFARQLIKQRAASSKEKIDFSFTDKGINNQVIETLAEEFKGRPEALQDLDFTNAQIDNVGMETLASLGPRFRPRKLAIAKTLVSEKGLKIVSTFTSLESLDIQRLHNLEADSLTPLGHLKNLKELDFSDCYPTMRTPLDLKFIAELKKLEVLKAESNRDGIDNSNVVYILPLKHLRFLNLSWDNVGNEGFQKLCQLPSLMHLLINGGAIDYRAIPVLSRGSGLRTLELDKSGINEESLTLISDLQKQKKLHLEKLSIKRCPRLSDSAIRSLQSSMPNCQINVVEK